MEHLYGKYQIPYRSAKRTFPIQVMIIEYDSMDLKGYADWDPGEHCRAKGCEYYGQKWSCPPVTPDFRRLSDKYKLSYLLLYAVEKKYFSDIEKEYFRSRTARTILRSLGNRAVRELEGQSNGYALLYGRCNLCRKCSKPENEVCKKPEKLRYSMEAVGLIIQKLVKLFPTDVVDGDYYILPFAVMEKKKLQIEFFDHYFIKSN